MRNKDRQTHRQADRHRKRYLKIERDRQTEKERIKRLTTKTKTGKSISEKQNENSLQHPWFAACQLLTIGKKIQQSYIQIYRRFSRRLSYRS